MLRITLCILILPFIQIGYSYYLSGAAAGAILLLTMSRENLKITIFVNVIPRLFTSILLILAATGYQELSTQDILRACREAIFFFLITGCVDWKLSTHLTHKFRSIAIMLFSILIFLLILTSIQFIFLQIQIYFGLPKEFFIQNEETIAELQDLLYSDIRPAATYGEPSYLAGVVITICVAVSPLFVFSNLGRYTAAVGFLIAFICRSGSGIFGMCLIVIPYYKTMLTLRGAFFVAIVGLLLLIPSYLLVGNSLIERASIIGAGEDASAVSRIFDPIVASAAILIREPTGISPRYFLGSGQNTLFGIAGETITHNGMFNFVLFYGWIGLIGIGCLFFCTRFNYMTIYIILISMQNGAFLSVDKFFLIGFAYILFNSFSTLQVSRSGTAPNVF